MTIQKEALREGSREKRAFELGLERHLLSLVYLYTSFALQKVLITVLKTKTKFLLPERCIDVLFHIPLSKHK